MHHGRRSLLRGAVGAAAALTLASPADFSQDLPVKAQPLQQPDEGIPNPNAKPKTPDKAVLQENQKDIKKHVEKLFELVSQLKEQVEKTDFVAVLPISLVRKAEEIEKLAHQIKERAKG